MVAIRAVGRSEALRVGWRIAWTTRLAVVLVAVFAALSSGPAAGGLGDPLLSPLARFVAALWAAGLGLFTAQSASRHWIS